MIFRRKTLDADGHTYTHTHMHKHTNIHTDTRTALLKESLTVSGCDKKFGHVTGNMDAFLCLSYYNLAPFVQFYDRL